MTHDTLPSTRSGARRALPWLVALAATAGLLLAASPAAACSCLPPGPPLQSMEQADAVFSGEVVSVEPVERKVDLPPTVHVNVLERRKVTLELDRVWKGCEATEGEEAAKRVELTTGAGGGDCGYDFMVGESYVVYAYAAGDGGLTTGICSRTARLADAGDDLASLPEPIRTVEREDGSH